MFYKAKTFEEYKKQYERSQAATEWKRDLDCYNRHLKMQGIAKKLNTSPKSIEYIDKRLAELEAKWPQLRKSF